MTNKQEMKNSIYSIGDLPSGEDYLNIEDYVKGLSTFISKCHTPMTLSINGDWGTGKTSIMKQICKNLGEDIISLEFNTWQYSQFNMDNYLAILLITDLIRQLGEEKNNSKEILDNIKKIVPLVITGWLTQGNETITNTLKSIISSDEHNNLRDLKNNFQELIDNITITNNKRTKRVVIFIDDLDRLAPSKAVELLEVLKLFLDCEGCVFVLAIDYNVVIRGVESKYGKEIGDKGRDFFEKIIQVPFRVPVENYDLSRFLVEILDKEFDNENDIEKISSLLKVCTGNNPRKIKRILNLYGLASHILSNRIENMDKIKVIALQCLQMTDEERYNSLISAADDIKSLEIEVGKLDDDFKSILSDKIEETEKILFSSTNISLGVTEIEENYERFWEQFGEYLTQYDDSFPYQHSGNKVGSKYYRLKKTTQSDLYCELFVNQSSVGLTYGNVKDEGYNKSLNNKLNEIKEEFKDSGYDIIVREWKNNSKNNYNNIPGVRILNSKLGRKISDEKEVYEWFVSIVNKLDEMLEDINQ
ncbi:TPA: AAA family ATPase [Streptococcus suis]|nr:AAA family ATPase [Streptococcus suis]HEM6339988.1 AAA family ATPase [Streptococcus suis]HEM6399082.1 AAA family ATPase [Streptococcus suis]